MALNPFHFRRNLPTAILLFILAATTLQSQTIDVCEDKDCPSAIFSVQLDAPLQGPVTPQRTELFKAAYLQVQQVKNGLTQDPTWESRYHTNALGGKSCVRLNQLESYFAYEYERNLDFKQFIDQNETDVEAFKENGFESSRRSLNLIRRMEGQCPGEIEKLNRTEDPSTDDLPQVYMELGQALGYFSPAVREKPVACSLKEAKGLSKLFKGKRIKYLNEKTNEIPLGPPLRDEINGITEALAAAGPEENQLGQSLEGMEPRFASLLRQPTELSGKLETNAGTLRSLQDFKPKNPKNDLTPRINGLADKREGLSGRTEELDNEATRLKSQYGEIRQEFSKLQNELSQRQDASEQMQIELEELVQRKAELTSQLEKKPKEIKNELEEIARNIEALCQDANSLTEKAETEARQKDEALKKLAELAQAEKEALDQLGAVEEEAETLAQEQQKLEEEIQKLEWEIEQIKKEEATVDGLKEELAGLASADALKKGIDDCEEEMKKQQENFGAKEDAQNRYETETAELSKIPAEIVDKLAGVQLLLNKLKLGYDGIPASEKSLKKIEQLLEKASIMGSSAEILTDRQARLQQQVIDYGQNLEKAKALVASMGPNLAGIRQELTALSAERSGIQNNLNRGVEDVDQAFSLVNAFLKRYSVLEEKSGCPEKEKIEALEKEQEAIDQDLEDVRAELNDLARYQENLGQETAEVEQEAREHTRLMKELKQEETALKQEFGGEIALAPVPVEEWKEADQVERGYWEASVVSDDELVRGFKGKYFEISLTDAEKKAKILFKPGRYYMGPKEFRTNYGATIGSFVNEALLYLKQSEGGQVKLFIQGSADISGHNTFRGRLNSDFSYEEVTLLPLDPDKEHFLGEPQTLDIPASSFTNDDLPNLRARYLKEILGAYTDKFEPIVLEGVVQETLDEEKRNAVIYLFFPEELLGRY